MYMVCCPSSKKVAKLLCLEAGLVDTRLRKLPIVVDINTLIANPSPCPCPTGLLPAILEYLDKLQNAFNDRIRMYHTTGIVAGLIC